jgi:hypothetical protein
VFDSTELLCRMLLLLQLFMKKLWPAESEWRWISPKTGKAIWMLKH